MKTFFVFAYDEYYPVGGMRDFKDCFSTLEEVEEFIKREKIDITYDFVDIEDISQYLK